MPGCCCCCLIGAGPAASAGLASLPASVMWCGGCAGRWGYLCVVGVVEEGVVEARTALAQAREKLHLWRRS